MGLLTRSNALLNQFSENITIFSVEENSEVNVGDFVVVNTRTLQASRPKKESGYVCVGRAVRVINSAEGSRWVICKDGMYQLKNTKDWENKLSDYHVGEICYFEDGHTVSADNINTTKAGEVISVSKKKVLIEIDSRQEVSLW